MTTHACKIQSALGCDVSARTVTFFSSLTRKTITVANEASALRAALKPYAGLTDMLAVCEATGGYEDVLIKVLESLAIPTHRADAAKVKAFIRSFGTKAKTDPIDARFLAAYGLERDLDLPRWQADEPQQARMKLLVARRADLVAMRVQETNRLAAPRNKPIAREIRSHVGELNKRIAAIETEIEAIVASSRQLKARQAILRAIPGIGAVLSTMLITSMPELGQINRRKAASLAACALHPRDSGTRNGYRTITGGRRHIRPALFTAALAAIRGNNRFADIFKNLVKAGKPKRLAINAVMRHIIVVANARLRALNDPVSN